MHGQPVGQRDVLGVAALDLRAELSYALSDQGGVGEETLRAADQVDDVQMDGELRPVDGPDQLQIAVGRVRIHPRHRLQRLGRLATQLDPADGINYYPILSLASESSYMGKELFNYGLSNCVGRNTIDGFMDRTSASSGTTGRSMLFDYDNHLNSVGGDETFLQGGDSGGPSFTNWNGQLALLGVHWFQAGPEMVADGGGLGCFSGDTFVPNYLSDIERRMTIETLTVIPEPSTLVLWLLASAVGVGYGWRKKRRTQGSV